MTVNKQLKLKALIVMLMIVKGQNTSFSRQVTTVIFFHAAFKLWDLNFHVQTLLPVHLLHHRT